MVRRLLTLVAAVALALACDSPTAPRPVTIGGEPDVIVSPPVGVEPLGLPPLTVSGTRFYAGGQPFVWAGVTAFDLPVRIAQGDARFLDWAADEGFTIVRIIPASVFRTPRTLDDGVAQLGPALDAIAARGLYAEVVVGVDTAAFGLTAEAFRAYATRIAEITNRWSHVAVELANENTHGLQGGYLRDWRYQADVLALFRAPARSAGSTHGGEPPLWNAGTYVTHHAARDLSPERNAAIMAAAQNRFRSPLVDDEAIGIAAYNQPGRRTNDPDYGARQAREALRYGLGGVTLHLEAGIEARVDQLDDVQREAARRFIAVYRGH